MLFGSSEETTTQSSDRTGFLSPHALRASSAFVGNLDDGELRYDTMSASLNEKKNSTDVNPTKKQNGKQDGDVITLVDQPKLLSTESKTETLADGSVITTSISKYSDYTNIIVIVTTNPDGITTIKHSSVVDPAATSLKRQAWALDKLLEGKVFDRAVRSYLTVVVPLDLEDGLFALRQIVLESWDVQYGILLQFKDASLVAIPLLFDLLNMMTLFPWPEIRDPLLVSVAERYKSFSTILNGEPMPEQKMFNYEAIPKFRALSFVSFDELNAIFSSFAEAIIGFDIELVEFGKYVANIHSKDNLVPAEKEKLVAILMGLEVVKHNYVRFTHWLTDYMDFFIAKIDHGWNVPVAPNHLKESHQPTITKILREYFVIRKLAFQTSYKALDRIFDEWKSIISVISSHDKPAITMNNENSRRARVTEMQGSENFENEEILNNEESADILPEATIAPPTMNSTFAHNAPPTTKNSTFAHNAPPTTKNSTSSSHLFPVFVCCLFLNLIY